MCVCACAYNMYTYLSTYMGVSVCGIWYSIASAILNLFDFEEFYL